MLLQDDFNQQAERLIEQDGGFHPLDAQYELAKQVVEQKRVVAMLPTGTGKTLGAALPFALGMLDPLQMCFMTPLRTLTSAQAGELRRAIRRDVAEQKLGLPQSWWRICEQTGTVPEDTEFEASAVVTTFDQAISSALRIGYSLSKGRRTVNAGAVLSSYLVADELHLFPRNEALTTLLCLLKHRPPELPFLLMTATLTPAVAKGLAALLEAEVVDGTALTAGDRARLGVEKRERRVRWQTTAFTAEQIARAHQERPGQRILVVVNTVNRAIGLGEELRALVGEDHLRVLHSRFYQGDRTQHEEDVKNVFGKKEDKKADTKAAEAWRGEIVVATQVVEVGLDISAGLLFSEIAPANALVQRWGRCARWGGKGEVIVAPPPDDKKVYPYAGESGGTEIVAKTRAWLEQQAGGGDGLLMSDEAEKQLLIAVHQEADEEWIKRLTSAMTQRITSIGETIAQGLYARAGELIRHVDTRTVLIYGDPTPTSLPEPQKMQGFSLAPGTLHALFPNEKKRPEEEVLADDEGESMFNLDAPGTTIAWKLMRPVWPGEDDKSSQSQANKVFDWEKVEKFKQVLSEPLLVINPELVSYDPFFGLKLTPGEKAVEEKYWAQEADSKKKQWQQYSYQHETLEQHVQNMLDLYDYYPVLGPRLKKVETLVERWCGWPEGLLDRLIRAAIVAHDAGKLSPAWQKGIADFQRANNNPVFLWLAHSDSIPGRRDRLNVPPHALSGAAHSQLVGEALDALVTNAGLAGDVGARPSNILFTAVATHHSPNLSNYQVSKEELLDSAAIGEYLRLLHTFGLPEVTQLLAATNFFGYGVTQAELSYEGSEREGLVLALVTRMLRLADGWSQDSGRLAEMKQVRKTMMTVRGGQTV